MGSRKATATRALAVSILLITSPCFAYSGEIYNKDLKKAVGVVILTFLVIGAFILRQYFEARASKRKALRELKERVAELQARNNKLLNKLISCIDDSLEAICSIDHRKDLEHTRMTAAQIHREADEVLGHALHVGETDTDAAYDYMRGRINLGRYNELISFVEGQKTAYLEAKRGASSGQ